MHWTIQNLSPYRDLEVMRDAKVSPEKDESCHTRQVLLEKSSGRLQEVLSSSDNEGVCVNLKCPHKVPCAQKLLEADCIMKLLCSSADWTINEFITKCIAGGGEHERVGTVIWSGEGCTWVPSSSLPSLLFDHHELSIFSPPDPPTVPFLPWRGWTPRWTFWNLKPNERCLSSKCQMFHPNRGKWQIHKTGTKNEAVTMTVLDHVVPMLIETVGDSSF